MSDAVPHPSHVDADSMLSRKFGKETVHHFSSSPLNRVSFLRSEPSFLSSALKHPSSRFILFNKLAPLTRSPSHLHFTPYQDIESVVPLDFFEKSEQELIKSYDSRKSIPLVVFLGIDESQSENGLSYRIYKGAPYFAVDITPKASLEQKSQGVIEKLESQGLSFDKSRILASLVPDDAAIYAQSRALIDWNSRNEFCGACGHPTMAVHAGTKRVCPPVDAGLIQNGSSTDGCRPPCHTRNTISNISFPRTDPTIIVAVISHDSKRILLGRQKRYPPYWYSTLAGFIEPGESVEDAVRREVWEESGVLLSRVLIHSTQPWPYPANLMIGAIGQVASSEDETVKLVHDRELEDARWFDVAEVEEALRTNTSSLGEGPPSGYKEGSLRLPPASAIAHHLISAAVKGEFLGTPYVPRM